MDVIRFSPAQRMRYLVLKVCESTNRSFFKEELLKNDPVSSYLRIEIDKELLPLL